MPNHSRIITDVDSLLHSQSSPFQSESPRPSRTCNDPDLHDSVGLYHENNISVPRQWWHRCASPLLLTCERLHQLLAGSSSQQRSWATSTPISTSFSTELVAWLSLKCQISPINPDLALHFSNVTELFSNKGCSISTESQPAAGMQGCSG